MDVNTDDLSAFLNRAWQNAKDGANTLPAQLLAEQQTALSFISTGSLSAVAKNSTSQSYGGYNPGNLTHRQITSIFTTLLRQYQTLKDKIIFEAARAQIALDGTFDFDQPIYDLLTKYFQVSTSADRRTTIRKFRDPFCHQTTEVCP